ncbi:hypothetical protein PHLGIDRAFT_122702 [Phlebiopsis gigantea 11061_1 CR5-6]|uniref:Uncharacterized protein n=1 Tax=Phlebiopsis gigantea (strain 11061_1 CR5-6) TaxID=745531 RepID=A0A0C3RQN0_PHLG1|nr:hypothetical protein PHLGIDRAFT_122702 [Phlebiopsis gigantea 11061_1 CR5-6]
MVPRYLATPEGETSMRGVKTDGGPTPVASNGGELGRVQGDVTIREGLEDEAPISALSPQASISDQSQHHGHSANQVATVGHDLNQNAEHGTHPDASVNDEDERDIDNTGDGHTNDVGHSSSDTPSSKPILYITLHSPRRSRAPPNYSGSDDESDGLSDVTSTALGSEWPSDDDTYREDLYDDDYEERSDEDDYETDCEHDKEVSEEDEDVDDTRSGAPWELSSISDSSESDISLSEDESSEDGHSQDEEDDAGPAILLVAGSGFNQATRNTTQTTSTPHLESEALFQRALTLQQELSIAAGDDTEEGEDIETVAGGPACHPWARVHMRRRPE